MTKITFIILLVLVVAPLSLWSAGVSSAAPDAGSGMNPLSRQESSRLYSISGKVTDLNGSPVPNLSIHVCDLSKQPVLLIRGGDGPEELSEDIDGLAHLYQWMREDGYEEGCNLFYAKGVSAFKTREQNREAVRENLRNAYDHLEYSHSNWQGHFDIIGHSFGGLIARFYLESAFYEEDQSYSDYGIHVDNLFTLGTPHGGALLPEEMYPGAMFIAGEHIFSPEDFEEFLSVAQLNSYSMDAYNFTHTQPAGVRYHLLGGDFLLQENVPFAIKLIYVPYAMYPGDIGVSLRSSGQLGVNPQLQSRYPQVCLFFNDDMHGYSESFDLGNLKSYVRPDITYSEYIQDVIGSREQACPSSSVRGSEDYQLEPNAPFVPPLLLAKGTLTAGQQTAGGTFPVDWAGQSLFYATWYGGDIDFSLTGANGVAFTPHNTQNDPQIIYEKLTGNDSGLSTYVFENTKRGEWEYSLTAKSSSSPITYAIYAYPDTVLAARASAPELEQANRPAAITTKLAAAAAPTIAHSNATVKPSKPVSVVESTQDLQYRSITDENGNYTINDLASGEYTVIPSQSGETFAPETHTVTVPPNATAVDFIRQSGDPPSGQIIFAPLIIAGAANN